MGPSRDLKRGCMEDPVQASVKGWADKPRTHMSAFCCVHFIYCFTLLIYFLCDLLVHVQHSFYSCFNHSVVSLPGPGLAQARGENTDR